MASNAPVFVDGRWLAPWSENIPKGTVNPPVGETADARRDIERAYLAAGGEVMTNPNTVPEVMTAGLPVAAIAGGMSIAGKALSALGISVPSWLGALLGIGGAAGAGVGVAQLLGAGEGGGLFGNNLLGGDTQIVGGVELGGPGLAEPSAQYVIKEWARDTAAGRVQYYKVQLPGWRKPKTLGYYTAFKRWVVFKAPHLAVIGKGMPSHRQLTRLRRNMVRHSADARTILKITSPKSLRTPRRGRR